MSHPQTQQPAGNEGMSVTQFTSDVGKEYAKGAAKEGGKETTEYMTSDEGQQHIDDAKAQAQGMWAKYCGCFGSV